MKQLLKHFNMQRTIAWMLAVGGLLALGSCRAGEQVSQEDDQLGGFVESIRDLYTLPAVSIAVVSKEQSQLRGFGVREPGFSSGVTEDTTFPIFSVTKVYLGLALARLADAGALSFDDRVSKWIPDFQVQDKTVVENATIKHLLAHTLGVESENGWLENVPGVTLEEVVKRIQNQPQAAPIGEYYYSDIEPMLAARILEVVTGQSWAKAIRTQVLEPLGLKNTYIQAQEFVRADAIVPTGDGWGRSGMAKGRDALQRPIDIAPPVGAWPKGAEHLALNDLEREPGILPFQTSPIDPSGSAYTSASDMRVLVQMLLNKGRHGDRVFLSPETFEEITTPVLVFDETAGSDGQFMTATGSAPPFEIYEVGNAPCFGHTGGSLGAESELTVCPSLDMGVFVVTTGPLRISGMTTEITKYIFRDALGLKQPPFANAERALDEKIGTYERRRADFAALVEKERLKAEPLAPLTDYVGSYEDNFAGTLHVAQGQNDTLTVTLGEGAWWSLVPLSKDAFLATWDGPRQAQTIQRFARSETGAVESIMLPSHLGGPTVTLRKTD